MNTTVKENNVRSPHHLRTLTENHYNQLVQALPAAVYMCDAQGRILLYNRAAVMLWGREPEVGKDLWCGSWRIFRPDGSPLDLNECPMAITIREGRAVHGEEIIIERPDGVRRYVLPHPRAIFDSSGNLIQAVNMLVDITELKKQEQAVRESEEKFRSLAANVEKQVEDRTRELQTTNRELVKSNDELEQFAYVASHDLQEPLRKIHAFTNLLEHHLGDENKSKYYIGKIADSSGKMMALIRELLDFSKLSTSREPYAKVDLNELIDAVKDDFELVIKQRNASIESSRLPIIDGIRLHFHQLFHNLLSNSLKFCKEDVQPRISIDVRKMTVAEVKARPALNPQLDYTVIEWKDNGMGFSQQYADHIFTIFQRLDHPPAYPGTGIGLALCRKIVTDHHGEIYARSEESQGATFFVILPETQETQDAG